MDRALAALAPSPPDVFNHNLETVPHLYAAVRPGADYRHSLKLLRRFSRAHPSVPTKSGLMLGLGETLEQVRRALFDLRESNCQMLTSAAYGASLSGDALCPAARIRHARRRGARDGLRARGQRPVSALVLPCRRTSRWRFCCSSLRFMCANNLLRGTVPCWPSQLA